MKLANKQTYDNSQVQLLSEFSTEENRPDSQMARNIRKKAETI